MIVTKEMLRLNEERLRTEADLCRNETADDVAALLDEAADEIQRYNDPR